ncbi:RyR domain-containing protein [soil metagenome]
MDPIRRPPAYSPDPVPMEEVRLSPELLGLTERIAERVHDLWARGRLDEGWTCGPSRDDVAKTHPGLVDYADLAESEKEYDRRTALETLRLIVSLGYRILPPQPPPGDGSPGHDDNR